MDTCKNCCVPKDALFSIIASIKAKITNTTTAREALADLERVISAYGVRDAHLGITRPVAPISTRA